MKKNNIIVFGIAALLAAFLLWLWFYLGFNKVDDPFDLALAITWWVGIAVLVALIVYLEHRRQRQIRTIYVSSTALYNSEKGTVLLGDAVATDAMQEILQQLSYGFDGGGLPDKASFECLYVVKTDEYKKQSGAQGQQGASDEPTWKGTVVKIDRQNGNAEMEFANIQQLQEALAA